MHFARILLLVSALAFASVANSQAVQDPHASRRTVDVYVLPYYQSADRPGGRPTVMVAKAFDAQLSSDTQADIVAVRDAIQADPRFTELKSRAAVDRHHFDDPATVVSFRRNREANHADEQFCWKS